MSIKINFVRGDEILTTTMSVGRTMLDAAKKLKIPEIPAICNGSVSYTHLTLPTTSSV